LFFPIAICLCHVHCNLKLVILNIAQTWAIFHFHYRISLSSIISCSNILFFYLRREILALPLPVPAPAPACLPPLPVPRLPAAAYILRLVAPHAQNLLTRIRTTMTYRLSIVFRNSVEFQFSKLQHFVFCSSTLFLFEAPRVAIAVL
jgi:hypothetical protein